MRSATAAKLCVVEGCRNQTPFARCWKHAQEHAEAMRAPAPPKLAVVPAKAPVARCVYCGAKTKGRGACHAHSDLVAVDPQFRPASAVPHQTGERP